MNTAIRVLVIGWMAIGVATAGLAGQGNKGNKAGKGGKKAGHDAAAAAVAAPADGESTFVGTLTEETKKSKKGEDIKTYTLITEAGDKVVLPSKVAEKLNFASLLNQKVTVVGKGEKKGKSTVLGAVKSIAKAE